MKLPHRRQFLHLAAGAAALTVYRALRGRKSIHAAGEDCRIICGWRPD